MSNYPVDMSVTPDIKAFFDPDTNTISYVVEDPGLRRLCNRRFRYGYRLCRGPHHLWSCR
jgi:hypothetical protein